MQGLAKKDPQWRATANAVVKVS